MKIEIEIVREFLKGRKTYLAVGIGAFYLAGVWAGCWELDEKVLSAVGLGGLAFLRMAVGRGGNIEHPTSNNQHPEKNQTSTGEPNIPRTRTRL